MIHLGTGAMTDQVFERWLQKPGVPWIVAYIFSTSSLAFSIFFYILTLLRQFASLGSLAAMLLSKRRLIDWNFVYSVV